ncbi:hypothetical protein [Neobacillus vireti]|uniref:hypothetical protein n=1 Tax=Neobacillus vireti TaxID=220686 RepID=UPI0030004E3D
MLKENSIILVFTVVVFLIILLVSSTPMLLKILLALNAVALLFPIVRKTLLANKGRKIKVAFYTSLIFTVLFYLLAILSDNNLTLEVIPFLVIVLLFSLVGNFAYGLPVSIIAELTSNKFLNYRSLISGFIHIGFGLGTFFIEPEFFIPAIVCSVIFFALDEKTSRTT